MAQYLELFPDGETLGKMASVLKTDVDTLVDTLDQLGLFDNCKGRVHGNVYRTLSGAVFPIDLKKMRIDSKVVIRSIGPVEGTRVAQISGFPLTIPQRKQLEDRLRAL